ncbi:hypothetical protein AMAG_07169 [Allomyces macrogynus ATCC 38327]|uniref:Uncharacterized protein n=1 Tax=Allomyces macrogynus (strain ATCC 38327) TaxID=578462 RepID=A0A0L0SHN4_ALLM3|nr:hypothetical protein AMAG_07169 [Allomyces macrogynus ATCC 38327]|eukprot:KNE61900.1 hypothetical protein AMAG_07169 [Allomyces macrogynus ATCC 38327]
MDDDDPTRQVLVHLTRLVDLDLSGNLLRAVSGAVFPACLTTLVLAANQLTEIPPVANLPSLVHLNLSYNRINELNATTLTMRTPLSLKSLDLSFNRLSRLGPTVAALVAAPNVRIVSLMGNPIALATQYAETIVTRVPHLVFFDDVQVDAGVRDGTPPAFVDTGTQLASPARVWLFIGSLWGLPATPPPLPTAIHASDSTPGTTGAEPAAAALPSTLTPPPPSEYMYAIEIWDVATNPAPATFTSSAVPPITSKSTPKEKAAAAAAAAAAEAAGNGERAVKWNVLVEKTCTVDAKLRDTLADPLTMRLVRYWVTWDPIARDPPSPNSAKRAAAAKKKGGAAATAAAADASHDFRKVLHDRTVLGDIPIDVSELLDRNSYVLAITPAVGYGAPHATLSAELAVGLNGPPKDLVLPTAEPGSDGTPPPVSVVAPDEAAPRVNAAALAAEFAKERETVAAIAAANTAAIQAMRDVALGASHGNGKKMGNPGT